MDVWGSLIVDSAGSVNRRLLPRDGGEDEMPSMAQMKLMRAEEELSRLKAAMMASIGVLGGLSMGTEGHTRGRICSASNALNGALNRTQSYHGDKFDDRGNVVPKD